MASRRSSDASPKTAATANHSIMNNKLQVGGSSSAVVEDTINKIPHILPHERVFPIQIGGELFKLSGASLSSDAPSYFSQYFLCQLKEAEDKGEDPNTAIKTLYIDRDPVTFRDIALHLQGYHIAPRHGTHFVRLFADAQFYSLPRLISQLYEESIFITIGHREFQIQRDIFLDPGNSPNFFSLGFAAFFSRPDDLFPGLDRDGLLRPPSIIPPSVPNRSSETFAELLHLLRGYPVNIRDEAHRQDLLRDARYFHFKGLEQRLVAHHFSYNQVRDRDEIVLRLESIQKSGIGVALSSSSSPSSATIPVSAGGDAGNSSPGAGSNPNGIANLTDRAGGYVTYVRPYVDEKHAELILEIAGEATKLHFDRSSGTPIVRAEFFRDTRARVARLLEVVATKLNLPPTTQPLGLLMASGGAGSQPATPGNTPLSEDRVRVDLSSSASITLDGREYRFPQTSSYDADEDQLNLRQFDSPETVHNPRKRRRTSDGDGDGDSEASDEWTVKTGQWRLRIQPSSGGKSAVECVLEAVKVDASSSERARNKARKFLDN